MILFHWRSLLSPQSFQQERKGAKNVITMKFYRAIQNFVSNNYANCSCDNKTITSILKMINHRIMHCFFNIMKATFETFFKCYLDIKWCRSQSTTTRIQINQIHENPLCQNKIVYYRHVYIFKWKSHDENRIHIRNCMVLSIEGLLFVDYVTVGYFVCCSCITH